MLEYWSDGYFQYSNTPALQHSSTPMIHGIVFDFDGTLVQSKQLKYDAYFELFPKDARHEDIIRSVLAECFEASRYVILERILRMTGEVAERIVPGTQDLAERYNDIVTEGAKTCPETPGASDILRELSPNYTLYLSSTNPEAPLREIVEYRGWTGSFKDIYGYPRHKNETIVTIMQQEQVAAGEMMVVGDGESDRTSAEHVGCAFFDVTLKPLSALPAQLAD